MHHVEDYHRGIERRSDFQRRAVEKRRNGNGQQGKRSDEWPSCGGQASGEKGDPLPEQNGAGRLQLRRAALSDRLGRGGQRGLAYNRERSPHPFRKWERDAAPRFCLLKKGDPRACGEVGRATTRPLWF